jgi:hypothetical protein
MESPREDALVAAQARLARARLGAEAARERYFHATSGDLAARERFLAAQAELEAAEDAAFELRVRAHASRWFEDP